MDIREMFEKRRALLSGHFLLSSGLHSDTYFQSALILQYPKDAQMLGEMLAAKILEHSIKADLVISPALGGIIIGQEVARALNIRAIWTEKVDGKSVLRRGFSAEKGERAIVVEDVITTGLSSKEVMDSAAALDIQTVALLSLVDRSGGKASFEIPKFSLLCLDVKTYEPSACPICAAGGNLVKPGSRK